MLEYIAPAKNKKEINYFAEIYLPSSSAYSIHVMKMCDTLANTGLKVNLIVFGKSNKIDIFKYYNCKSRFNIINSNIKKNNFLGRVSFAFKAILKYRNKKNDLILSRSIIAGFFLSFISQNVTIEIHHKLIGFTKIFAYLIKNSQYFRTIKFIFITKYLSKDFLYKDIKSIILDDGVELNDFLNFSKQKNYKRTCVYTGSFTKGKGVENIINIAKCSKNTKFHLYGDLLNSSYSKEDFSENVVYKGYVRYCEIPKILKKYQIVLMPYSDKVYVRSKNLETSKYMSPLKLFEYMASDRVIVAKYLNVYSHILNNKNSILIHSNSPRLWASRINTVFNNIRKYRRFAKKAHQDVKKYSWEIRVSKLLSFINT
jgi:hypothetical protein